MARANVRLVRASRSVSADLALLAGVEERNVLMTHSFSRWRIRSKYTSVTKAPIFLKTRFWPRGITYKFGAAAP